VKIALSRNLPHSQTVKLVEVCENTLRDYFKLYQEGGIDNLRIFVSIVRRVNSTRISPYWKPILKSIRRRPLRRRKASTTQKILFKLRTV